MAEAILGNMTIILVAAIIVFIVIEIFTGADIHLVRGRRPGRLHRSYGRCRSTGPGDRVYHCIDHTDHRNTALQKKNVGQENPEDERRNGNRADSSCGGRNQAGAARQGAAGRQDLDSERRSRGTDFRRAAGHRYRHTGCYADGSEALRKRIRRKETEECFQASSLSLLSSLCFC